MTNEAHGISLTTTVSNSGWHGFKVTIGATDVLITKFTKHSNHVGSVLTAKIFNSGQSEVASASYTGDEATFNYVCLAGQTYYFKSGQATPNYTGWYGTTSSYPVSGTNLTWIAGNDDVFTDYTGFAWNIVSVDATPVETDAHGITFNDSFSSIKDSGMVFEVKRSNTTLTKVTKSGTCTATKAYLRNDGGSTLLASADFVGNVATFSYALTNGLSYYLVVDDDGNSFTHHYKNTTVSYPISGTNIDWVAGLDQNWQTGGESALAFNIVSIAVGTVSYYGYIGDNNEDGNMYSASQHFFGENFTLTSKTIEGARVRLKKIGSPTGTVYIEAYRDSDKVLLASKSIGDASTITTSWATYIASFDTPLSVSSDTIVGTRYSSGGNSSNYIRAGYTTTNPVSDGRGKYLQSDDTTWTTMGSSEDVSAQYGMLDIIIASDDRSVKTDIELEGFSDRAIKTNIEQTDYSDRSVQTEIELTDYNDRTVQTQIEQTGYRDRDIKTQIKQTGYSDRGIKTLIEQIRDDERDLKTEIEQTGYSDRNVKTNIQQTAYSDRAIKTNIEKIDYSDRAIKTNIEQTNYSERDIKTNIEQTGYSDRGVKVFINYRGDDERSVKTNVEAVSYSNRAVKTQIEQLGYSDRGIKTDIEFEGDQDRAIKTQIELIGDSDRAIKTEIELTNYSDRNIQTEIEQTSYSTRGIKSEIEQTGYSDRGVKTFIEQTTGDDAQIKTLIEQTSYDERAVKVQIELTSSDDRSLQTEIEQTAYSSASIKTQIEKTGYSSRGIKTQIEKTSPDDRSIKTYTESYIRDDFDVMQDDIIYKL